MNINQVSAYVNRMNKDGSQGGGTVFSGLGKKGQIIQGTIAHIASQITIDFHGTEVNVAKNSIKDAKVGDARRFQIMDISKAGLVLKEIDDRNDAEDIHVQASTKVVANNYAFSEQLEKTSDAVNAQTQANEDLAILSGEDCQKLEEEEDSLTKNTKEYIERAVERNKEEKAKNMQNMQEGLAFRKEMKESLKKQAALGFTELKSVGELKHALEDVGIPATPENLAKVSSALDMSEAALEMTDQTKYYLISQKLSPTIEHLYQGKYTVFSGGSDGEQAGAFEDYKEQITGILRESGFYTEKGLADAKWLFEKELPINAATLKQLEDMSRIADEMTPERILDQVIYAMTAGLEPKEAVLDDRAFLVAKGTVERLKNISDTAIIKVADYLMAHPDQESIRTKKGTMSLKENDETVPANLQMFMREEEQLSESRNDEIPYLADPDASDEKRLQIAFKRQIEEIRQKMTIRAAVIMEQKGIHVETEALDTVVKELRQMENDYTVKQLGETKESFNEPELNRLQETLQKTEEISKGFSGALGSSVRRQQLLTMNELHSAVSSATLNRSEWKGTYETVCTQVRADLGDSIQKAFKGIPALLKDVGIEDTEANQRAARILGYNSMEITKENINEVKMFDAKVNDIISNMKPTTVLELIRRGDDPLDTPLDELNQKLKEINAEKNVTSEEKYSRFLWQMEKDGKISEEERTGYIGVYRLLHQIESSEGTVIGAMIESGRDFTLGNLLTQVRIRKSGGIDAKVDDQSGARESVRLNASITDQIQKGFTGNKADAGAGDDDSGEAEREYQSRLIREAMDEISPSKLYEITDGDMEKLLNVSVERFAEQLKGASGNQELRDAYYENLASELREELKDTDAAEELLVKLQTPNTVENLLAAKNILENDSNIYREIYGRKKVLSKEREEELNEVIDRFEDSVDEEALLQRNCEQAEKIMEEVLTKSMESADIEFEDLQNIRSLSRGLRLQTAFRRSKSYDIPIRTGDTITSLNLTIVRGADETGKVQISMEDGKFGHISLDFKVVKSSVKGLVLCEERQGYETLRADEEKLDRAIENAGFSVKNISYGMDFKSRNELLDETAEEEQTDTKELYRLSKVLVRQITALIKG